MKSLLVITENFQSGGGDRYMADCVSALSKTEQKVTFVSHLGGPKIANLPTLFYKPVTRARWNTSFLPVRVLLSALFLIFGPLLHAYHFVVARRLIRKTSPDQLLLFNGGYPGAMSLHGFAWAAHLAGIPVTMSIVSMPAPRNLREKTLGAIRDQITWRSLSKIQVNAQTVGKALIAERNAPADKISVVHNGVFDDPHLKKIAEQKNYAATDRLTIGFTGRIETAKGVWVLLTAAASLLSRHPHLIFEFLGDGADYEAAKTWAKKNGYEERLRFLGFHSGPIGERISHWDIFAFPSLHEGLPYSLIEAMRAGLPIVASSVGGIPELIVDKENGLLVPPNSSRDLESALDQLISQSALRRALGQRARKDFESHWSLARSQRQYLDFLDLRPTP